MLGGQPPFTGPSVQAIVASILSDEPAPLEQKRKIGPAPRERRRRTRPGKVAGRPVADGGRIWRRAGRPTRPSRGRPATFGRPGWHLDSLGWRCCGGRAGARGRRASAAPTEGACLTAVCRPGSLRSGVRLRESRRPSPRWFGSARMAGSSSSPAWWTGRRRCSAAGSIRSQMQVIAGAGQGDQGTGNSRPFVSPDGRWVAYFQAGEAAEGPGGRRARHRPRCLRLGRRELGPEREAGLRPLL